MLRLLTVMLCISCSVTLTSFALADTYYVSLAGADSAAGSYAAPWRTIQHGADALKPGDTLNVEAGVYREHIELKNGGTAGMPVTISSQIGAHVIITGADRLRDWKPAADLPAGIYVHDWP